MPIDSGFLGRQASCRQALAVAVAVAVASAVVLPLAFSLYVLHRTTRD